MTLTTSQGCGMDSIPMDLFSSRACPELLLGLEGTHAAQSPLLCREPLAAQVLVAQLRGAPLILFRCAQRENARLSRETCESLGFLTVGKCVWEVSGE